MCGEVVSYRRNVLPFESGGCGIAHSSHPVHLHRYYAKTARFGCSERWNTLLVFHNATDNHVLHGVLVRLEKNASFRTTAQRIRSVNLFPVLVVGGTEAYPTVLCERNVRLLHAVLAKVVVTVVLRGNLAAVAEEQHHSPFFHLRTEKMSSDVMTPAMRISSEKIDEKVFKHVGEMMSDRGYDIVAREQFRHVYKSREDGSSMYVYYIRDEDKLTIKTLRTIIAEVEHCKSIVISGSGPTSFTKREIIDNKYDVELFKYKDFVVNISRHVDVPVHAKLCDGEKKELFETLGTTDGKCIPKLLKTDAMCRYYAFKVGDVIRITRTVGYQEERYFYRIVTEAV